MISSIKVASIKPEVSEFFRCLLISLRLSDSDKNFLTLRMTVVLLFFFLGFCLCSPLTMCLFRLKAELNVLEHSFHKYLSDTLTLFSLTKMPKPAAFLLDSHVQVFSRVFSHVYLSKLWFEFCSTFFTIPRLFHLVRLFFVHLLVVSVDIWLVCTFVRTLFTFVLSLQVFNCRHLVSSFVIVK